MDFVSDALFDGRRFRVLTLVDHFTRESPAIEVGTSITGKRVVEVLEQLKETCGLAKFIATDNGTEFTSRAVDEWAHRNGVNLDFIRPGNWLRTRTSRASMEGFARSVSICTGSLLSKMPRSRSKRGERTTTTRGRTALWGRKRPGPSRSNGSYPGSQKRRGF